MLQAIKEPVEQWTDIKGHNGLVGVTAFSLAFFFGGGNRGLFYSLNLIGECQKINYII